MPALLPASSTSPTPLILRFNSTANYIGLPEVKALFGRSSRVEVAAYTDTSQKNQEASTSGTIPQVAQFLSGGLVQKPSGVDMGFERTLVGGQNWPGLGGK